MEYNANVVAATAKYGPIAGWDVSRITSMKNLFKNLDNFNANINSWDTSSVTNMFGMFQVRSITSLSQYFCVAAIPTGTDLFRCLPFF